MAYQVNGNTIIDDSGLASFTNLPPVLTPTNLEPLNDANVANGANIVITASTFSGIHNTHRFSRWLVANVSDFAAANIVHDSGNVTGTNSYAIPAYIPAGDTIYWKVQYASSEDVRSEFSESTCFNTFCGGPEVLGQAFEGGYYSGVINRGDGTCYFLLVSPNSSGCACCTWGSNSNTITCGNDGYCNTYCLGAASNAGNWTATRSINGYTDWYLPSLTETSCMWTYRSCLPAGEGYPFGVQWTSTNCIFNLAWIRFFNNNATGQSCKACSQWVRAVRRHPVP